MEVKRQLGVNYDTAWKVKHKLLQAMKESEDKSKIGGIVQLDDVYWGGEHRGGKRGRGAGGKTPFLAAVALNEEGHPVRMKMTVVEGLYILRREQSDFVSHRLTLPAEPMCTATSLERDCAWLYLVKKLNECCAGKLFANNLIIRIITAYNMKG
ncbi:hypothetical protein KUL17_24310 [Alteromonas sp. KUL17]|nr:hypothetical protein KUL17_24310 [Alteromonas sp. KUL17]